MKELEINKVISNQELLKHRFYTRNYKDYFTLGQLVLLKSYEKIPGKLNFEGSYESWSNQEFWLIPT